MTESGTITSGTETRDGFWGTLGWLYPGLGLAALVGMAFSGPSAIEVWAPWEHLGRMTVGVSAALAIGGGVLALCVGWIDSRKRRSTGSDAPDPVSTVTADADARVSVSERTEEEAADPTATRLGRLSSRRIVLWLLLGAVCLAMGMLGEVSQKRTNRMPIGTKTGDAVSFEIWAAALAAAALAVAALVILCLVEDRVRRTSQREWLREQLRETTPPAKRTRQFYRGRSTPHASRACALLAAPLVSAGLAVLLIGSVEMGGPYAGSKAAYADLRIWGIVAILVGLLLLAVGVVRATRWHRENTDLRAEIQGRWPSSVAVASRSESGKG